MKYFGGIMGIMQYILPLGTFAIAIKLACDEGEELNSKLIQYVIAIISLAIVFSVFQISSGELQSSKDISEIVKDAYYYGSQGKGGGAIGAVAAVPLTKLLGDVGAIILSLGIATILLVFTFGINLSELINMIMDKIEEKRDKHLEKKLQQEKDKEKKDV